MLVFRQSVLLFMCNNCQFLGLAKMDFVCFKVLKQVSKVILNKKNPKHTTRTQTPNILVCALSSTLLAPPQVATLALTTAISVLTVLFCSCSLYCSVWWILRLILAAAPVIEYVVTKPRLCSSRSRPQSSASASGCEMDFMLHQMRRMPVDSVNWKGLHVRCYWPPNWSLLGPRVRDLQVALKGPVQLPGL